MNFHKSNKFIWEEHLCDKENKRGAKFDIGAHAAASGCVGAALVFAVLRSSWISRSVCQEVWRVRGCPECVPEPRGLTARWAWLRHRRCSTWLSDVLLFEVLWRRKSSIQALLQPPRSLSHLSLISLHSVNR